MSGGFGNQQNWGAGDLPPSGWGGIPPSSTAAPPVGNPGQEVSVAHMQQMQEQLMRLMLHQQQQTQQHQQLLQQHHQLLATHPPPAPAMPRLSSGDTQGSSPSHSPPSHSPPPPRPAKPAVRAGELDLPPGGTRVGRSGAAQQPSQQPSAPGSATFAAAPPGRDPPWLLYAGIPNDGSVSAEQEVAAFASFVAATSGESARRRALRTVVQKIAHIHISPEATAKLIGSVATGLDNYASGLDIAIETPMELASDSIERLQHGFEALGVETEVQMRGAGLCLAVLSHSLQQISPGWVGSDFTAYVYLRTGNCPERASAQAMRHLLEHYPTHRRVVLVARSILKQMNLIDDNGGLPSHALSLMAIALFEMLRDRESFGDTGWVLREFFRFYATFDFGSFSISTGGIIPKVHPEDQMSVIDPARGLNAAANTRKLSQITAMFHYVTTCIQRFDRIGSRSLLCNIVAHNDLWARMKQLEQLKQSEGCAVTKEFALKLVDALCGFFSDPRQSNERERFAKALAADSGGIGECVKREVGAITQELGLVEDKVRTNPNSRLRAFASNPTRLAEMVLQMGTSDADVQERLTNLTHVAASPAREGDSSQPSDSQSNLSAAMGDDQDPPLEAEVVINMMTGLADHLEDPAHSNDLRELTQQAQTDGSTGKIETKFSVLERIVEYRLAQNPQSRLARFRHNIPALADKVWDHWGEPAVQAAVLRIVTLNGLLAKWVSLDHVPGRWSDEGV
eukprot:Hpha_TRINITY_DN11297_c0_g1::TRINITY_DN11297_c0_g1_i1::g.167333::m.167333